MYQRPLVLIHYALKQIQAFFLTLFSPAFSAKEATLSYKYISIKDKSKLGSLPVFVPWSLWMGIGRVCLDWYGPGW